MREESRHEVTGKFGSAIVIEFTGEGKQFDVRDGGRTVRSFDNGNDAVAFAAGYVGAVAPDPVQPAESEGEPEEPRKATARKR